MKVLFIGNSHTYFNDMPELFARFAEMASGEKPETVMLSYGMRDLAWHWQEYFALRFNLLYGGYDYCVFQQAAHPYPPAESTLEYGKKIIDLCRRVQTVPVVYMTWAEERLPENQQKMIDICRRLASEGALLAPIGEVWQAVRRECPDIKLYYGDGEHAGVYGVFLIAAVLCRLLTGRLPQDVSGIGLDFLQGMTVDLDHDPAVIEDKDRIPVPLDKEKTDRILAVIRKMMPEEGKGT